MFFRSCFMLGLLAVSATSFAAADLSVSISGAPGPYVYQTSRYTINVANVGAHTAAGSKVEVQLPVTNTYPTYIMGVPGSRSASCTLSGSKITCTLGDLRKKAATSVYFDIALPETSNALALVATASTTSSETVLSNNTATIIPPLLNYAVSFTAPRGVLNEHCTGTGLTSYYECTLFPGSISSHATTLHADHTITFGPEAGPEYTGTWSQESSDHLAFVYYENGVPVADFEGYGVSAGCWEGPTIFPNSAYMSMYRVCLQ